MLIKILAAIGMVTLVNGVSEIFTTPEPEKPGYTIDLDEFFKKPVKKEKGE